MGHVGDITGNHCERNSENFERSSGRTLGILGEAVGILREAVGEAVGILREI